MIAHRRRSLRRPGLAPGVGLALMLGLSFGPSPGSIATEPPQRPGAGRGAAGVGATDGWAFTYRPVSARPGRKPELDLRSLNEAKAGQSGFVRLSPDGSSFVLGSGEPVRFWAINSDQFRASPEAMAENVRFLARIGVNMVRIHAQLSPKEAKARSTDVDEKELDGIFRYVAAAKDQGIYTTISPYWAHSVEASSWGIEGYGGQGDLYGLLFFDPTVQTAFKAWAKALLTRVNPYTKVPLGRDPAVAILQVQNEDSLFFWTFETMKPPAKTRLAGIFTKWATRKHGSVAKALAAWGGAKAPGDDPGAGRLGFLPLWNVTQTDRKDEARRASDQVEFIAEHQRRFYEGMAAYFRDDLHCGQLVNASNWRTASEVRLDDLERWSYAGLDVLAVNRYYNGGVHLGPNSSWRIDPGDKYSQVSGLLDPRNLPFNLRQVVGHPIVLSESGWVNPLPFGAEGPFLTAAYTALTGVDALYWFSCSEPSYNLAPSFPYAQVQGQHPLTKWSTMTPTVAAGFPAAALLFRKGYVRQAEPAVHEERPLASLWAREAPILAEGPTFDPNRDRGVGPGGESAKAGKAPAGVDPLAFLVGPVEVQFDGDPSKTRVAPSVAAGIDRTHKVVRSATGELTLDYGVGLSRLDTPKAQGACGFFKQAGPVDLKDVAIRSTNSYAAVLVVPLDDQPLAQSRRVLVQVTTAARPTGWATSEAEFAEGPGKPTLKGFEVVRTGAAPWRVANTEVALTIKNPAFTKATRLDTAGLPAAEVPLTRDGAGVSLTLPPNTLYLILE